MNVSKVFLQSNATFIIVLVLLLGSLAICLDNPKTDSKFLDLAQAGLGGYLAIQVQNKSTLTKE